MANDMPALEELPWTRLRAQVLSWARRWVSDPEEAEDLTQDVLAKALGSLPTFRWDAKLTSWTFVIARNQAVSKARRAANRRRAEAAHALSRPNEVQSPDAAILSDLGAQAQIERLQRVLRLTPVQKKVLRLTLLEGLNSVEAGRELGLAAATVRSHVRRIRHRARSHAA